MMPRIRRALGIAAMAALALFAVTLWQKEASMTPSAPSDAFLGGRGEPLVPAPGTTRPRPVEPADAEPLPPEDRPLASLLGPLAARADAGDRKAACRLGMELLRCEHLEHQAALMAPPPAPPDDQDARKAMRSSASVDFLMREPAWIAERLAQCKAVPTALAGQGARYLEQAALAGEPEAMVRYAEGQHWPPSSRGAMADPSFDRWRRNAPGMMRRALKAGYPEAAFALMIAYQDDGGFHAALIPNDPEQAAVIGLLYARLYGSQSMEGRLRGMDAASQAIAIRQAEAMHREYFQGRRFSGSAYPYPAFLPPVPGQTTHDFCREP
ncbi:hypothetical protein [Arenimonas sp.]|uniref:hypothetical protein n=1 Tax=Arenimonas sp. TaxID=1872635 RepID=UPI002E36669B|nr:hypothetical protein [Arenimonas sp.]HEX4853344.1 hypothetical protein [Arenimonas sp.]